MRVAVRHGFVNVVVTVRFPWRVAWRVGVVMVLVVHMPVGVRQQFMLVFMEVPFRNVEPHACGHEQCGDDNRPPDRLAQKR